VALQNSFSAGWRIFAGNSSAIPANPRTCRATWIQVSEGKFGPGSRRTCATKKCGKLSANPM
jgi:hypothetical protein